MIELRKIGAWRGIRVLYWDGDILYGSRGYELVRLRTSVMRTGGLRIGEVEAGENLRWESVATFRPEWWRNLTTRTRLTSRLVRDGFHALVLPGSATRSASVPHSGMPTETGIIIGAVPGAIVTRYAGDRNFRVTHKIMRGTRPLHITAVPNGNIYWGEYFDNRDRAEVHIYASTDGGETWQVAHTFPAGEIRHVHNIVYDRWSDCVWILTGDEGSECKVIRATSDLRNFDTIIGGHQHARAVAALPSEDALYLSTDTPADHNHVLRAERGGRMEKIADLESSSIYGCQTVNGMFFSTTAEPSPLNETRTVTLVGASAGRHFGGQQFQEQGCEWRGWHVLARWQKDAFPMHYFQYGNAILPDGVNATNLLAATTVAVKQDDQMSFLWETVGAAAAADSSQD